MLKKIIKRFFIGLIIEVFVTYVISIINSLIIGDGTFYSVAPQILKICNSEVAAVCLQFILSGLLGGIFGISSIVWEIDKWSLALQTLIHFFIITISMLIVAYICCWMPHSIKGFLCWLTMFIVVYIIIWIICYLNYKHKIKQVNESLKERNKD